MPDTRKVCGKHFYRPDAFKDHLTTEHGVSLKDMGLVLKQSKIGKNCQTQHWCGFCQVIRPLKEKRNDAWDERFDHIAYHFEKEKKSIDEWLCAEANKTKKQLFKEMRRDVFDDDDEEKPDVDNTKRETPDADLDAAGDSDDGQTYQLLVSTALPARNSQLKRKRTASPPSPDESEVNKRVYTWECVCIAGSCLGFLCTANCL